MDVMFKENTKKIVTLKAISAIVFSLTLWLAYGFAAENQTATASPAQQSDTTALGQAQQKSVELMTAVELAQKKEEAPSVFMSAPRIISLPQEVEPAPQEPKSEQAQPMPAATMGKQDIPQAHEKGSELKPAPEVDLSKMTLEERFNQLVSLDLRNIDILEALKFVSTKGGINIVTTRNVQGRVTLTLINVRLKDVFDLMLRSNGLAYIRRGEIYSIMTEAEYKILYGKNFYDLRQVKVFRLKYAIPEQAFSLIDALKSEIGRVLVDPESGNVLLMETPERIDLIEKALEDLNNHPEVITEAIQTVLRREGVKMPYEKLKELTRGKQVTLDNIHKFINTLEVNDKIKKELLKITPENYTGLASKLASK